VDSDVGVEGVGSLGLGGPGQERYLSALTVRAEVARRIALVGWSLTTELRRDGDSVGLVIDGPELQRRAGAGPTPPLVLEIGRSDPKHEAAIVLDRIRQAGILPTAAHPAVFDPNRSIWCAPE
jgi:hypothetical protein